MAAYSDHKSKYSFMNCVLKVNTRSGWQKTVRKVLSDIQGVSNFTMDYEGRITVSGMVDPQLLLKRLGKSGKNAELCWFEFGECSSNLYPPPRFSSKSCPAFNQPQKGNGSGSYGPYGNGFNGGQRHYSGGEYVYGGYGGGQEYNQVRHAYRPFAPTAQSLRGRYAHFVSGHAVVPSAPPME